MSYFGNILRSLGTSLKGMAIVIRHLTTRKVTRGYPDPKNEYVLPERARNRLYVNMDDCIGCDKCARACPVNCIMIDTVKQVPGEDLGVTSNGKKKALWVTRFDIDMAQCCFCSLCIWPCPTECIVMTEAFEYSETERGNLIYHFATMDESEVKLHEDNWKNWEVEAAALRAKQAAERAAKTQQATAAAQASEPAATGIKPPPHMMRKPQPGASDADTPSTEGGAAA